MGLSINKNLKENRSTQWYTTAELNNLTKKKLFAILSHCNNHIPYYQKLFKDYSLDINGDLLNELKKIPILTKNIIKKHLPYDLTDKTRKIFSVEKTSGSSGEQGEFYLDREAFSKIIAAQTLYWEWAGYSFGNESYSNWNKP